MYLPVEKIRSFYESPAGLVIQRVLQARIHTFWPEVHGFRIMGCGYAMPYLESFVGKCERVFSMVPLGQGADVWPSDGKNLVFLSEEDSLPIESSSVDRILIIHHLECCDHLRSTLREIWRVLKPNGRVLIIVPNRMGFWARADWSPFGQGSPFSLSQLCFYLHENLFAQERSESALFVPPLRWQAVMRSSALIERIGRTTFPIIAGVHIVEASKQVYASIDKKGTGSPVFVKTKEIFAGGKATPVPQGFSE